MNKKNRITDKIEQYTKKQPNIFLKKKFTNYLTINGSKNKSEKTLLKCFKLFYKNSKKNSIQTIRLAINATTPIFLVKHFKAIKKIRKESLMPFIPKKKIRISYSLKNIILDSKTKNNTTTKKIYKNLANQLILSAKQQSFAVRKKDTTQEQAFNNKKRLANFRWF
jgi:ribosomal protein S7